MKGITGIAQAVQAVGNVADQAGLSFEQLSAIIATTMEQTRQDGSSIANGLKTIMVRISKATSADEEVDNETLSKASKSLHAIGVEVYNTNGEFRDFNTIMGELSEKWDTLNDAQQAEISFNVAATRQTAVFKSILQNWQKSQDMAAEATETQGNAMENQQKYMDSYAGKLQQIKNEMQDFWISFINSDAANVILDFLKALTKGLNGLQKFVGSGGILTLAIGEIIALRSALNGNETKGYGVLSELTDLAWNKVKNRKSSNPEEMASELTTITDEVVSDISQVSNATEEVVSNVVETISNSEPLFDFTPEISEDDILDNINDIAENGSFEIPMEAVIAEPDEDDGWIRFTNDLAEADMIEAASSEASAKANEEQAVAQEQVAISTAQANRQVTNEAKVDIVAAGTSEDAAAAEMVQSSAQTSVAATGEVATQSINRLSAAGKSFAKSNIWIALATLVMMLGSKIVDAVKKASNSFEEAQDRLKDNTNEYKNSISELNKTLSKTESWAEKYNKLSKGVDKLGKNISLTNSEYKEYIDLSNDIASAFPELISGFNNTGDAIIYMSDAMKELNIASQNLSLKTYSDLLNGTDENSGADVGLNDFHKIINGTYFDTGLGKTVNQYEDLYDALKDYYSYRNNDDLFEDFTSYWLGYYGVDGYEYTPTSQMYTGFESMLKSFDEQVSLFGKFDNEDNDLYRLVNAYADATEAKQQEYLKYAKVYDYLSDTSNYDAVVSEIWKDGDLPDFLSLDDPTTVLQQVYAARTSNKVNVENALSSIKEYADAYYNIGKILGDYNLDEQSEQILSSVIQKIDTGIASGFENKESISQWVYSAVNDINSLSIKARDSMINLLNFDYTNMSISEAIDKYKNYVNIVKSESPLLSEMFDDFGINDYYDELIATSQAYDKRLREIIGNIPEEHEYIFHQAYDPLKNYFDKLTSAQQKVWYEATEGAKSATEAIQKYEEAWNGVVSSTSYKDILGEEVSVNIADYFNPEAKSNDSKKTLNQTISDYKSMMSTLQGYLNNNSLSTEDKIALNTDFQIDTADESMIKEEIRKRMNEIQELVVNAISELIESGNYSEEVKMDLFQLVNLVLDVNEQAQGLKSNFSFVGDAARDVLSLSDGFSKLDSIMADVVDGGAFDYSSIINNQELKDTFGYLKSYDNFVNSVLNNPQNINANKQAFNDMISEWIYSSRVLDGLNEENALMTANMLKQYGVVNAEEIVREAYNETLKYEATLKESLAVANNNLYKYNKDLTLQITELDQATWGEITALITESEVAGDTAEQLIIYALNKAMANGVNFMTDSDVNELLELAKAANIATEQIAELEMIKQSGNTYKYSNWLDAFKNTLDSYSPVTKRKINYKGADQTQSAIDSAAQKQKELLDKQIEYLEKQLDANQITFNQYLNARLDLIQDYYDKGLIKAADYYAELEEYYKAQLDGYDNAIEAIDNLIDEEIKRINDEKQALSDANDERQKAIDLQKAEYELARSQNQRTRLIYQNGQMVYANDPKAIRDAEKELADQKYQEQIDALDKMVERLEKYKELWDKIPDSYEKAQKKLVAADLFGPDWEDKILNLDMDLYNNFTPDYADAEQNMRDAAAEAAKYSVDDAAGKIVEAIKDLGGLLVNSKKSGYYLQDSHNNEYGFFDTWEAADLAKQSLGELGDELSIMPFSATADEINILNDALSNLDDVALLRVPELLKLGKDNSENGESITEEDILSYYNKGYKLTDGYGTFLGFFNSIEDAEAYKETLGKIGECFSIVVGYATDFEKSGINEKLSDVSEAVNKILYGEDKSTVDSAWNKFKSSISDINPDGATNTISKIRESVYTNMDQMEQEVRSKAEEAAMDFDPVAVAAEAVAQVIAGNTEDSITSAVADLYGESVSTLPEIGNLIKTELTNNLYDAEKTLKTVTDYIDALVIGGLITPSDRAKWEVYYNNKHGIGNYSGTAYADGNWTAGSKGTDGLSLVGELGPEIRVRDGNYEVLGSNGAEFTDVRKDDIIFNHKQSKALLENGHINSRGKAYAQGKFTPLSNLSGGNFDLYKSLNIIADNIPDIKNSITKLVGKVTSPAFAGNNSSPTITVNNPTFTCPGVTSEEVMKSIQNSFTGLLNNAYQQVMK